MSENKIEKLKLYCSERLESLARDKEAIAGSTESDEAKRRYNFDLSVRTVEIEGFLLLLNMDTPTWGGTA